MRSHIFLTPFLLQLTTTTTLAVHFDWERIQLSEAEAASNSAISFGSFSSSTANTTAPKRCRTIPGDADWPNDEAWASFNETLGGALLKPRPLASVCYYGDGYDAKKCAMLRQSWRGMNLHTSHPTSIFSQWATGTSCPPTSFPNTTTKCTQGGYPVYVINATTTRHVQLGVNFARNNNIRLVVKNTGHDFNGKSVGGGALSVWLAGLKGMDVMRFYNGSSSVGSFRGSSDSGGANGGNGGSNESSRSATTNNSNAKYTGLAITYAAGTQAYEGSASMRKYNISFAVAGGSTVGIAGGFLQGGGHSSFTSFYGLAADLVLRFTAVVADGRVVEVDEGRNEDLFWAFRGGGGGTFGIITSVTVKAFPATPLVSSSIRFSTTPAPGSISSISTETFWAGVRAYWAFGPSICDAGGLGYNFVYPATSPSGLTFTVAISLPNKTLSEYRTFMRPFLQELNNLGISIPIPKLKRSQAYNHDPYPPDIPHSHHIHQQSTHKAKRVLGEITGHTLLTSRLIPRKYFQPSTLNSTHALLRHAVESSNYTLHGMSYTPHSNLTQHPPNAVNPAFRTTVLHMQMYEPNAHWDGQAPIVSVPELDQQHERLQTEMQRWRQAFVGSGSYVNEGDAQDREWQSGFWGEHWERLSRVKRLWDPWGVFYVVGGVGSEDWEVVGVDGEVRTGLTGQDGRLCRV